MTAPLFLRTGDLPGAGGRLVLDGPEGRHAATVRRLRPGEVVHVGNGAGSVAETVVASVGAGEVHLDVVRRRDEPAAQPRLVVVQALAKGDRGEAAVEAMTEVGVDEIVPWAAARSVVQWHGERGERALGRWRSTAREAAKQSRRAWLPVVAAPASTPAVAVRLAAADLAVVLHEDAAAPLAGSAVPAAGEIVVVVGPEGGIGAEELAVLGAGHARRLGPTVLRTSTAGVAAAALLLAAGGRWS